MVPGMYVPNKWFLSLLFHILMAFNSYSVHYPISDMRSEAACLL